MPLVRVENVKKIYRTNGIPFPALGGVSFAVEKGEFLSLAGPSGSGKTTMLNLIGCLDKPSEGSIFIDGTDLSAKKSVELANIRRFKIGFIFQTFNLIPILTAFENVEFPLILKGGTSPKERRALVEELLTEVGLQDFLRRKPSQLSGGQQQRVAIARALVKKPQLVLADEPTANLDSRNGREVLELMEQMNKKTETTFIFSTHDRMVMEFARRIIHLKDGKIEKDAQTKQGG
ncbi:MAG: ABC transporter ATP-binding protein [Candidatus Aminicenantes bacterium]|nr:ABC transporter ATP-binding protein [Candidatus Aminicenantes bacterium]